MYKAVKYGVIKVTSGEVNITDPCYIRGGGKEAYINVGMSSDVVAKVPNGIHEVWGIVMEEGRTGIIGIGNQRPSRFGARPIGQIGVDSGQAMLFDPILLPKWKGEGDREHFTVYADKRNRLYACRLHVSPERLSRAKTSFLKLFSNYEQKLEINGVEATVNQHISAGTLKEQPHETPARQFSYSGVSEVTLHPDFGKHEDCGQIGTDIAVVCDTGYGDGGYEVLSDDKGFVVVNFMADFSAEVYLKARGIV